METLTRSLRLSWRTEGSRSPARSVPAVMASPSRSATCSYSFGLCAALACLIASSSSGPCAIFPLHRYPAASRYSWLTAQ